MKTGCGVQPGQRLDGACPLGAGEDERLLEIAKIGGETIGRRGQSLTRQGFRERQYAAPMAALGVAANLKE